MWPPLLARKPIEPYRDSYEEKPNKTSHFGIALQRVVIVARRADPDHQIEPGNRVLLEIDGTSWKATKLSPLDPETVIQLMESGVLAPITDCPPIPLLALAAAPPLDVSMPERRMAAGDYTGPVLLR